MSHRAFSKNRLCIKNTDTNSLVESETFREGVAFFSEFLSARMRTNVHRGTSCVLRPIKRWLANLFSFSLKSLIHLLTSGTSVAVGYFLLTHGECYSEQK
jgi:hypothetical protein